MKSILPLEDPVNASSTHLWKCVWKLSSTLFHVYSKISPFLIVILDICCGKFCNFDLSGVWRTFGHFVNVTIMLKCGLAKQMWGKIVALFWQGNCVYFLNSYMYEAYESWLAWNPNFLWSFWGLLKILYKEFQWFLKVLEVEVQKPADEAIL